MENNFKPEVGKIYCFHYEKANRDVIVAVTITCEMRPEVAKELIEDIQHDTTAANDMRTGAKLLEINDYLRLAKKLADIKIERGKGGFIMPEEKQLEAMVAKLREIYFPPRTRAVTPRNKVLNHFIRAYIPENIELTEDGPITAVYAGKVVTSTGKVSHKWYVLSLTKVPNYAFDEKYAIRLVDK